VKRTVPRGAVRAARTLVTSSAAAVVLVSSVASAPTAALAGPTGESATTRDGRAELQLSPLDRAVMAEQEPYMELDEQVRRVAAAQATAPLAGTRVDVAGRTLQVHWVGAAPAELTSIQDSAARRGISVKILPAAFSEKALMAAATELSKVSESRRAELSITIHHDGSGLTVRQDGLPAAAQDRNAATRFQAEILDAIDALRARSGVPVGLADSGPRMVPATRADDHSPFWGGAVTRSFSGSCTDAFSMYATGSPSTRFMLTAAHCTNFEDDRTVTNGPGYRMGNADFIHELFDIQPRYDLGVIRLDSNFSNKGSVYSNELASDPFLVKGMASGIPAGGRYCVSAAVSTPNCNLVSDEQILGCWDWIPFGRCVFYVSWISATGLDVYCHGDSGGPIYYWTSTGIIAAGVVGTGVGDRQCTNAGGISVVSSAVNRIPGLAVLLQ
jgi:hypothetical protein